MKLKFFFLLVKISMLESSLKFKCFAPLFWLLHDSKQQKLRTKMPNVSQSFLSSKGLIFKTNTLISLTNSAFFKTPPYGYHFVSVRNTKFKIISQEYFDEKFSESNNRIFIFWFPVYYLERESALFTEYSLITCWSTDIIWYYCSNWFHKSIKSIFSVEIGNLHNMSRNRNMVSLFNLYFLSGLHVHCILTKLWVFPKGYIWSNQYFIQY